MWRKHGTFNYGAAEKDKAITFFDRLIKEYVHNFALILIFSIDQVSDFVSISIPFYNLHIFQ